MGCTIYALIIQDVENDIKIIEKHVQRAGFVLVLKRVQTLEAMSAALESQTWDIVIFDCYLRDLRASAALDVLEEKRVDLPFVIFSDGFSQHDLEVAPQDNRLPLFLQKPLNGNGIRQAIVDARRELDQIQTKTALYLHRQLADIISDNNFNDSSLEKIIGVLKNMVHCTAVALRVVDHNGAVSSQAYHGFKKDFFEQSCPLSSSAEALNPSLCVNVLMGKINPECRFFTPFGSWYVQHFSTLLKAEAEINAHGLCQECQRSGFETMILVPLRAKTRTVGLLHLADSQESMCNPWMLILLEDAAPSIATAIERETLCKSSEVKESFYQLLFELCLLGIGEINQECILQKSNTALAQMFGCELPKQLIGKKCCDFFSSAKGKDNFYIEFTKLQRIGDTYHCDQMEITHLDQSISIYEISVIYMQKTNNSHSYIVIIQDITENCKLNIKVAQTDRLTTLGLLAASVAHEINNPLTYTIFNLEILNSVLSQIVPIVKYYRSAITTDPAFEGVKRLLANMESSIETSSIDELADNAAEAIDGVYRIRDIVHDLNFFSKIEANKHEPISLNQVIEKSVKITVNEIKFRARLVMDLNVPDSVLGNKGRLCQLFINLLINASQAIEEGDITHNEIHVRTFTENKEIIAEIADTGCGIAAQDLDHIFDPFFSTKTNNHGTGLGLPISHNIINAHGGRVTVKSKIGQGTCVMIRLPLYVYGIDSINPSAGAGQAAPKVNPESTTNRRHILVVDDEPIVGKTIQRILEREHDVTVVTTGVQAKMLLKMQPQFDLIFCDLMMPDISGMGLHDWLAEHNFQLSQRMVFITGGTFTPQSIEFAERYAERCLKKPFTPMFIRQFVQDFTADSG